MKLFLPVIFIFSLLGNPAAANDKMREFLISCAYGTLAGAIAGAATLAFEDDPGDHLQRVAKGASLGLYAGIALGIYVTQYYDQDSIQDTDLGEPILQNNFFVSPLVSSRGFEGLHTQLVLTRF